MEKVYIKQLHELIDIADKLPNSRMMSLAKVAALITMNMRYEKIMIDRNLKEHPYPLTKNIVNDTITHLKAWAEISFIERLEQSDLKVKSSEMEKKHHELFQDLWVNFSVEEYKKERIGRYVHRLTINGLGNQWLKGKRCIDFGCGHGNFAHALIDEGAEYVFGIDFGEKSIDYANRLRDEIGVPKEKMEFAVGSVYNVPKPDGSFDFAIQNGVFHHLDNEDKAYKEVYRVLKPGGWFWVYTDGKGAISHDLWDASTYILKEVPHALIVDYLTYLNIDANKRYHLGDGLNATYRHTTYEDLTDRLSKFGFGNFRRLTGGFPTDFDHDVVEADKYGKEKFGSGDIRILVQKVDALL